MIEAVDRALVALMRQDVLGDAVEVSLDAPNRPWSQAVKKPTLNLFLFDVRENLARREVMVEPVRDASGVIVARRPPPSRYDLFYILSCWAAPPELEHQILSAVVASLASYDVIPAQLLGPDAPPHGFFLSTAGGMKRGMLPTFGGELKIQLDLAVTVPFVMPSVAVAGRPVQEPARIRVEEKTPEEIAIERRRTARLPAPRVPEDDPFAATRAALAEAVAAAPPPAPAAPPAGQRGAAPGQRPGGAPAQRPGGPAPGQRPPGQPGARPAGAPAGPPPNPLVVLRAALGQAAQAQAALAQAVSAVASLLPAPPAQPPAPPAAPPAADAPAPDEPPGPAATEPTAAPKAARKKAPPKD